MQVDPPDLGEGETFANALEVLRGKIEVAQNRLRQIKGAILPLEEVQQAIDEDVARLVATGERTRCTWDCKRLSTLTRLKIWTC